MTDVVACVNQVAEGKRAAAEVEDGGDRRINKHEVLAMRRFAEEDLGAWRFKMDGQINPRIDCSQSPLAVRLTPGGSSGVGI